MTKNTRRFIQRTVLLAAIGASSFFGLLATPAQAAPSAAAQSSPAVHVSPVEPPVGPALVPSGEWPW